MLCRHPSLAFHNCSNPERCYVNAQPADASTSSQTENGKSNRSHKRQTGNILRNYTMLCIAFRLHLFVSGTLSKKKRKCGKPNRSHKLGLCEIFCAWFCWRHYRQKRKYGILLPPSASHQTSSSFFLPSVFFPLCSLPFPCAPFFNARAKRAMA